MQALLPRLVKSRTVPSLRQLCLRAVARHAASLPLSRLPPPLADAVLLECQERFMMEDAAALRCFFAAPVSAWRARESFVDTAVFDEAVAAWGGTLRRLELCNLAVSPDSLVTLGERLPHLTHLSVKQCAVLDDPLLLRVLSPELCGRLESVWLSHLPSRVTDAGLAHLAASCPRLTCLSVEGCNAAVLAAVAAVCAQAGPRLRELRANDCGADDKLALVLAKECPNLELLEMHDGAVTDRGMKPLLRACRRLRHLRLSLTGISCDTLTLMSSGDDDEDLGLVHLDLSLLYNVTKEAVQELLYRCGNLEELSLKDNDEVDDETVDVLCTCCTRLKRLNLAKCGLVTDRGVSQIVAELEQLQYLNVRKCDKLTPKMRNLLGRLHMQVEI